MGAWEVVVVLPVRDGKLLMQLRDKIDGIDFPGHWGLFGGAIEVADGDPGAAAQRELFEEVGYWAPDMRCLDVKHYNLPLHIEEHRDLVQHSFYCSLAIPPDELELNEGMDWGLFSQAEILSGQLYSQRWKRPFPVVPNDVMLNVIVRAFALGY